jgi:hypothetical protein
MHGLSDCPEDRGNMEYLSPLIGAGTNQYFSMPHIIPAESGDSAGILWIPQD